MSKIRSDIRYPLLASEWYIQQDVVFLARDLLGKILVCNSPNGIVSGIITETEAYAGITDKASHAYGNKRSERTEIMYHKGGTAYVYLCYGIHSLFNVVTNAKEVPHAVLIRSIYPLQGVPSMMKNAKKEKLDKKAFIGPGKVSKLMGIHYKQSGLSLLNRDQIWIEDSGFRPKLNDIIIDKRVGIDYAEEDAELPYRFILKPEIPASVIV